MRRASLHHLGFKNIILTAGTTCRLTDGTHDRIVGIFASDSDARSIDADDLALAILARRDLTPEQWAIAIANTDEMADD